MTALAELIARLEAAPEGSRELDAEIWFLSAAKADGPVKQGHEDYGGIRRTHWTKGSIGIWDDELPHYTTSIDAALTLVPTDYAGNWDIKYRNGPDGVCTVSVYRPSYQFDVHARTPALALCAAALKAREA